MEPFLTPRGPDTLLSVRLRTGRRSCFYLGELLGTCASLSGRWKVEAIIFATSPHLGIT